MKPMIMSIHFKTFFRAKPIAYPRRPLPAKGIMLDNKGSLLICARSFAPHDVLKYIRNEGRQSLSFQANCVERLFWPSYRIHLLLLLSPIHDVWSVSSILGSCQHDF